MIRKSSERNVRRYWWHSLIATTLVAVAPSALVLRLESIGHIDSSLVSSLLAIAASALAGTIGAALWMRHSGSSDILFSELMIWGFMRRLFLEKRVMESTRLLSGASRLTGWHAARPTYQVQTLQRLASALEGRDPYTHGHSRRVARLSTMIAKQMGLPSKRVQFIRTAAMVHDVGKLYVPSRVINKRGRLSEGEFATIKLHSAKGAELVAHTGNQELAAVVRHHHERFDGSGYPDGLAGVNIPLGARIIAVADTFDAITSTRSYRPASNHKFALSVLRKEAGRQLDPDAVHAFLAYYTGRRSLLRWVVLFTGPHRVLGQAMGWFQGAAASTAANAATVGTAAIVSGSLLVGGASLAPAVASHFEDGGGRAAGRTARMSEGSWTGRPPGLAKKDKVPSGLAKKDKIPPGWTKKAGGGRAKNGGPKVRNERADTKKAKKQHPAHPDRPGRTEAGSRGNSAGARSAHQPTKTVGEPDGGSDNATTPTNVDKGAIEARDGSSVKEKSKVSAIDGKDKPKEA